MIQIPTFRQGDPKWGSLQLGTSGHTMATHGCYVTSVCMILNAYGLQVDPGQLVKALNANGGFTPGGELIWQAIERLYPRTVIFRAFWWTTQYTRARDISKLEQDVALANIARSVELGMPILAAVDLVNNDGWPDHAIVIMNCEEGPTRWRFHDPAFGDSGILGQDRYDVPEKAIYGYRQLVGPPLSYPDYTAQKDKELGVAAWKAVMVENGIDVPTYSREIADHILGL